jgi:hypothetical protein
VILGEEAQQILRGPLDKDSTSPSIFPNPKTGKLLGRWKREGDHGGRYTAVGDEFQLCGRSQRVLLDLRAHCVAMHAKVRCHLLRSTPPVRSIT